MKNHQKIKLAAAVLFCLTLPPQAAHADVFRFVDDYGVVHFSNIPESHKDVKVVREEFTRPKPPAPSEGGGQAASAEKAGAEAASAEKAFVPNGGPVDAGTPYGDIILAKCEKYGVDPTLVKSVIKAESNFNPRAVSPVGARGLMQLMPATAADMGVSDSFDPEQNIDGGVKYLKFLLDNFNGDVELSVAAYNCGQGRVIRNGYCVPEIKETKNYVKKVLKMSENPITGASFSRPIYRVELRDGSILFTDTPGQAGTASILN